MSFAPGDQRCPPPPSFLALFSAPAGRALSADTVATLTERHDLCENLARQLAEIVRVPLQRDHLTLADMLPRCRQVVQDPDVGLSAAEAQWVLTRLAEVVHG